MSLEEVLEFNHPDDDSGIYQVYGDHIVFGPQSLLYIGKAQDQSFRERFLQHSKGWICEEVNPKVFIGRIHADDSESDSDWKILVDAVEALTIYWHSPPYNSQHINEYGRMPLCVHNLEDLGDLQFEYTSCSATTREIE